MRNFSWLWWSNSSLPTQLQESSRELALAWSLQEHSRCLPRKEVFKAAQILCYTQNWGKVLLGAKIPQVWCHWPPPSWQGTITGGLKWEAACRCAALPNAFVCVCAERFVCFQVAGNSYLWEESQDLCSCSAVSVSLWTWALSPILCLVPVWALGDWSSNAHQHHLQNISK